MQTFVGRGPLLAAVLLAVLTVASSSARAQQAPVPDLLSRGAYLVGDAGQCADCHGANLTGGPNVIPGPPGAPWAKHVPSLRGLPMFPTDAAAIAFLRTTRLPNRENALPPMPRYKFNLADATAIVAYLRSLK